MYSGGLQVIRNTWEKNKKINSLGQKYLSFLNYHCDICACWQTYTQSQVQQSHPDIQSEEQNNIGHFAEQDDVAHVLLHSYWEQNTSGSWGDKSLDKPRK